jgi:hypothetical protein
MTAAIIGISLGLLIIFLFEIFKRFDKKLIYGMILTGIGFLYVGFVWTDLQDLVINSIQAIVFVFIAYYGVQKHLYILAAGFFLHGSWDITYVFWRDPGLIPPHYDLFCLTIDFVMGIYILAFKKHFAARKTIL